VNWSPYLAAGGRSGGGGSPGSGAAEVRRETRGGCAAQRSDASLTGRVGTEGKPGKGGGGAEEARDSIPARGPVPSATRGRRGASVRGARRCVRPCGSLVRWGRRGGARRATAESIDLSFCGGFDVTTGDGSVPFFLRATVTGGGTFPLPSAQFRRHARALHHSINFGRQEQTRFRVCILDL
jgi:hypothetical protein